MDHMCMWVFEMHVSHGMFHIWNTLNYIFLHLEVFYAVFLGPRPGPSNQWRCPFN